MPRPVTPLGILAAKLERVRAGLGAVGGIPAGLAAELDDAVGLAGGLEDYLRSCTTPESPALAELAARTQAHDWTGTGVEQEMLSGHVEGQALKLLVHATGARRVLELGMFTGYSALAMAEALPEGGQVVACEVDPDVAAFARRCFDASPSGARIRVEVAPARDTLEQLSQDGEPFDLVFLDADKAGYAEYLRLVLDGGLLAPGGLVCADNTLMQGEPWTPGPRSAAGEAIAAFNRALADDARVEQVLLPLRDGLTLIRRIGPG